MAHVEQTVEIQRPVDEVWAVAGDPGRIGEWLPLLSDATLEGDVRVCRTSDGGELRERILDRSEEGRYYVYTIEQSPLPLRSYRSRLSVDGHGDHSHVVWDADFEPASPEQEAELTTMLTQVYAEGLASLRNSLEKSR